MRTPYCQAKIQLNRHVHVQQPRFKLETDLLNPTQSDFR